MEKNLITIIQVKGAPWLLLDFPMLILKSQKVRNHKKFVASYEYSTGKKKACTGPEEAILEWSGQVTHIHDCTWWKSPESVRTLSLNAKH